MVAMSTVNTKYITVFVKHLKHFSCCVCPQETEHNCCINLYYIMLNTICVLYLSKLMSCIISFNPPDWHNSLGCYIMTFFPNIYFPHSIHVTVWHLHL